LILTTFLKAACIVSPNHLLASLVLGAILLTTPTDMASSAIPTLHGLGSIPQQLYGVAVSLLVITWTAALARAYVRVSLLRSVGWDDWTLIPAQICYTVQCAYMVSMARMEMNPEANSSIRSISELVTVNRPKLGVH
jgi:hypothetical protein